MVEIDKDTARDLPVLLTLSGATVTGVAEGDVTVKIAKDLGTLTAFTLTGLWTEVGQGLYQIAFASGDLDTEGFFAYLVTTAVSDQYSGIVYVGDFKANIGTLIARLTADRAGYLDNLSGGAVALASALVTVQSDLDNPNQYKADVSNLDVAVSTRSSHSAADVWSAGSRTLTSFGTLVQDIWDKATSSLTTAGSIGKLLVDNIDAAITSRSSHAASAVWSVVTRVLTAATNITSDGGMIDQAKIAHLDADISTRSSHGDPTSNIKGSPGKTNQEVYDNERGTDGAYTGTPPTKEQIADQVWDEATADHESAGSFGKLVGQGITYLKQKEQGKWEIKNNQLIFYDDDGVTPIRTFNLFDENGNATSSNPFKREPL